MASSLDYLTPFARAALEVADTFAEEIKHRLIDPAHLWIGIWVVEGAASSVLRKLEGMTYPDVQLSVLSNLQGTVLYTSGLILPKELTDAGKAALEYAFDHARRLRHASVGTGHLLLGLLDVRDPLTVELLNRMVISPHELRMRIETAIENWTNLGDRVEAQPPPPPDEPFFTKLAQWFGKAPIPKRVRVPRPPVVPRMSLPPTISIAFLRQNAYDTEQLWLMNYAAKLFEDVFDKETALECYAIILRISPPNSNRLGILISRSVAYIHKKELDSALVELNQAISKFPDHEWGYINRGVIWMEKAENIKAIEDLTRAVEINPNSYLSFYNRAIAYRNIHQFDLSLADFDIALKLKPNEVRTLLYRGLLYSYLDKRDLAFADFATAHKLAPDDYRIPHFRGRVYRDYDEFEQAQREYETALKLKPNDQCVLQDQAWTYGLQKEFDKAIALYTQLIERDPEEPSQYVDRAFNYVDIEEYTLAAADLHNARQIKPDAGLFTETKLQYSMGNYEEAVQTASNAIKKYPKHSYGYFLIARSLDAQGKSQAALNYFKQALEHWSPYSRTNRDEDYVLTIEYIAKHDVDNSANSTSATTTTPQP